MKVVGIIAEYNPFHNGHLYHLAESKRISGADVCVAVMSGNFTQRGEAALFNKWERAKVAVDCGVDLVFELPFVYACNNAEYFAKGAISVLNGLSCVDAVSFGSESGDIGELYRAAFVVSSESDEFKEALFLNLKTGVSYPKARANAVRLVAGEKTAGILSHPNNVLAVEYLKQLITTKSGIAPITVKRKGSGYNSVTLGKGHASAAAVRSSLENGGIDSVRGHVPAECFDCLKSINIDVNKIINNMFLLLAARVLTESEEGLSEIISAGEGLGNKLKKVMRDSRGLEDLITKIKSKRYTRTRVQRLLIHTLMNLSAFDFNRMEESGAKYARALAFNDKGAALLKKIKKGGPEIPVITNINKQARDDDEIAFALKYDILASDLYNLISGAEIRAKSDYLVSPYYKNG